MTERSEGIVSSDWLGSVKITAHALDRFIERTGTTRTREAAEEWMRKRLCCAYQLKGQHWYQGGIIFCIKGDAVTTVMKPTKKWTQSKLHKHNARRS